MLQNVKKVTNDEIHDFYKNYVTRCTDDSYSKEIIEVKSESETRAIVFAKIKNNTPIPDGARPDVEDIKTREKGKNYKYVLEKDSEGWKVVQVYAANE